MHPYGTAWKMGCYWPRTGYRLDQSNCSLIIFKYLIILCLVEGQIPLLSL